MDFTNSGRSYSRPASRTEWASLPSGILHQILALMGFRVRRLCVLRGVAACGLVGGSLPRCHFFDAMYHLQDPAEIGDAQCGKSGHFSMSCLFCTLLLMFFVSFSQPLSWT